jgi:hypothetical protein
MLLQSTESILNNIRECSSITNVLITRSFDISFKNNCFILKFGCPPLREKGLCVGHWNVGSPHLQFSVLNTNDEDL